jgi:hypothetical protein
MQAAAIGASATHRAGPQSTEKQAALRALGDLLDRYMAGEFMPPDTFFGISTPEA